MLPADVDAWCNSYKSKTKIIHDSLWGTFRLQSHELAILDTLLLQRLRFIKQTGCTYLTYPSALHTRFEHTLGVLFQTERMFAFLRSSNPSRMGDTERNNLRCAALLHDSGHGPFSHTSEEFYTSLGTMRELLTAGKYQQSGAGEILSSFIVESKPFRSFVATLNASHKVQIDCDEVSQLITGNLPDDKMYLSEIVHGPFDADKLDYLHRDGMFSGLRMNVDLDRLLNSIEVFTYNGQTRLVGSTAGTTPLEQIMFNKMILHVGIYHHHKVRACDCMLQAIFSLAVEEGIPVGGRNLAEASDFLTLTDDRLLIPELTSDARIRSLIEDIRARRIWQRALVISRSLVPEPLIKSSLAFTKLVSLCGSRAEERQRRREIAKKIWEAAGKPCGLHEVWLDIPKPPKMNEAKRTWIRTSAKEPVELGDVVPVDQWIEQYETQKWRGHVFCPQQHRVAINKASLEILRNELGLALSDAATTLAKIDD